LKEQPAKRTQRGAISSGTILKRLYSIQEASVYLGRTVCALREMIWAGKLPYIRDGRRILLDIHDMNLWVEKNKTRFED
jgi:excisionase family DNA binding protein